MTYTVEPEAVEGCECEDCQAGRHLYSLLRRTPNGWEWVAISLQAYTSAEECKQRHQWGIVFGPDAVWEDGSPVVEPDPSPEVQDNSGQPRGGMVPLNLEALQKSADALERHWGRGQ